MIVRLKKGNVEVARLVQQLECVSDHSSKKVELNCNISNSSKGSISKVLQNSNPALLQKAVHVGCLLNCCDFLPGLCRALTVQCYAK